MLQLWRIPHLWKSPNSHAHTHTERCTDSTINILLNIRTFLLLPLHTQKFCFVLFCFCHFFAKSNEVYQSWRSWSYWAGHWYSSQTFSYILSTQFILLSSPIKGFPYFFPLVTFNLLIPSNIFTFSFLFISKSVVCGSFYNFCSI